MKPVEKGDIFHLCHVYLCSLKHFGFMFIMNRFCGRNRKLPLNFRILRSKYKLLNIGTFKKISRLWMSKLRYFHIYKKLQPDFQRTFFTPLRTPKTICQTNVRQDIPLLVTFVLLEEKTSSKTWTRLTLNIFWRPVWNNIVIKWLFCLAVLIVKEKN